MKKNLIFFITCLSSGILFSQVGINTTNPGSTMTVNGSFAVDYKILTANTTLGITDSYVAYNGSSPGIITLPAAISGTGNFKGRIYGIKNTGNSTLSVMASGTEQIDGAINTSSVSVPPGYYVELISKGTTTGTTWELSMFVNTTVSTITNVVNIAYATPQGALAVLTANVNGNGYTILPGSSTSFSLPSDKPIFLNYALGLDDLGSITTTTFPYFRCELFIDGVSTGLFQVVQQVNGGTPLQFNLSGVRNLSAGAHTVDVRLIRWFNNGFSSSTNQTFGIISQVLSATYVN